MFSEKAYTMEEKKAENEIHIHEMFIIERELLQLNNMFNFNVSSPKIN